MSEFDIFNSEIGNTFPYFCDWLFIGHLIRVK